MAHKGTVFKVKPESLIVVTGEFEFKEILKRQPAKPGQEIIFEERDILRPRKKRMMVAAVASLLIILLVSTSMIKHFPVPGVYAYVGMDINPSLELALDNYLKVIRAEAGNKDAEKILKDLSINGLHLSKAVNSIFKACSDHGYLKKDGKTDIMITTTINSPDSGQRDNEQNLEEQVLSYARAELGKTRQDVNVYVVQVGPEERRRALSQGVSAGRYYLWNMARENGTNITLEQVNSQSIRGIIRNNARIKDALAQSAAEKWNKDVPKRPGKPEKDNNGRANPGSNHPPAAKNNKGNAPAHPPGLVDKGTGKADNGKDARLKNKGNKKTAEAPARPAANKSPTRTRQPEHANGGKKPDTPSPPGQLKTGHDKNGPGKNNRPSSPPGITDNKKGAPHAG